MDLIVNSSREYYGVDLIFGKYLSVCKGLISLLKNSVVVFELNSNDKRLIWGSHPL